MLGYNRHGFFISCCVGLLVFASASLGVTWFVVPPAAVPTVWPASGMLLAALLLAPPPAWPLLLISAGVAMGLAQLWAGTSLLVSLALTLARLAEAILAARLVRRWSAAPLAMTRMRDLVGLVGVTAVASNALTALLGAVVVWASFGASFWQSWQIWFVTDGVSMLLLTPLALSWLGPARPALRQMTRWRIAEAAALVAALLLVGGGIFVANASGDEMQSYPLVPLLIWAVRRFQIRGVSVVTLFLASLITLELFLAQGPFHTTAVSPLAANFAAQQYLAIIAASAYGIAALVSERATEHAAQMQDKEALRASEATLHSFFDSAAVMMGIVELIDDDILHIADNAVARRFLNIPADISYPYCASASGVPLEHIRLWRTQYVACTHGGTPVAFEYTHTTTGGPRMLAVSVSLIAGPTDAPQRFAYVAEDVTERKQTEADLRAAHDRYAFQSSHDQLTGMLNRRAITDHVDAELARANRGSYPLSLALLDIDHFKAVNDQHGHLVGDHALIHIAQILTQTVRPFDWVGRWGGEEFLVVLSSTGMDDACMIAERLRAQIAANPLHRPDETELHLTVSIGVANTGLFLESAGHPKDLFRRADDALYIAKRNGRNQIRCADPVTPSVRQQPIDISVSHHQIRCADLFTTTDADPLEVAEIGTHTPPQ